MSIPDKETTQAFFRRLGYDVEILSEDKGASPLFRLQQPNNQGDTVFPTLEALWRHWVPRGNSHIEDDLGVQKLVEHYESASPKLKREIEKAVREYWKNPFFCCSKDAKMVASLSKAEPSPLQPMSPEWLASILVIFEKPEGCYGFAKRAAVAILPESDVNLS